MKDKTILFALKILFVAVAFSSCQMREDDPVAAGNESTRPQSGAFVPSSAGNLFEKFAAVADHEVVAFDLPNGTGTPWRVEAWRDGFIAPDFKAQTDPDGPAVFTAADLISVSGKVVNGKGGEVRLMLMRDLVGGSVILPEETWSLRPPQDQGAFKVEGYVLEAASEAEMDAPAECGGLPVPDAVDSEPDMGELPENARNASACSIIQVRADGDYEYFRDRAGSNLNLATFAIALTLHEASQKFHYVGNSFRTQNILVFTSPSNGFYYPTDGSMDGLLANVKGWYNYAFPNPNPNWDVVLLFTGKNASPSNVAGQATRVGALCKYSGTESYAVIKARYSATVVINITAHEMGHLAGAKHTVEVAPGSSCLYQPLQGPPIMSPVVSSSAQAHFTPCSRDQILWHRWFNHSCMGSGSCI